MKTRLNIDGKTMRVLSQPEGYTPMSEAFVDQYNATCHLIGPMIPKFNKENDNAELGQDEYERRYYELFKKCFNEVPIPLRVYKLNEYDGDDYDYEFRT